jgi:hypothetical protein
MSLAMRSMSSGARSSARASVRSASFAKEFAVLRYQFGTSKKGRGGRRYRPYAFTEQGVAMLSTVLNSERAIQVNLQIMRAFVRLRTYLTSHEELRTKLAQLERKYDHQFKVVFDAIQQMLAPPKKPEKIGFTRS